MHRPAESELGCESLSMGRNLPGASSASAALAHPISVKLLAEASACGLRSARGRPKAHLRALSGSARRLRHSRGAGGAVSGPPWRPGRCLAESSMVDESCPISLRRCGEKRLRQTAFLRELDPWTAARNTCPGPTQVLANSCTGDTVSEWAFWGCSVLGYRCPATLRAACDPATPITTWPPQLRSRFPAR
jgi:hypothetical protein